MLPCIIMIEGVIGAGKTTFCNVLGELLNSKGYDSRVFHEPIAEDDPALKLFLSDCDKYAFFFQIHVMKKRIELYEKALELKSQGKIVIIDRSLRGDRVFEEFFYRKGAITPNEHEYYLTCIEHIAKNIDKPDIILYLDVSVDDAISRISVRNRMNETSVYNTEYIMSLKCLYDEIYNHGDNVMVIDNTASTAFANYKTNLRSALQEMETRVKHLNI